MARAFASCLAEGPAALMTAALVASKFLTVFASAEALAGPLKAVIPSEAFSLMVKR